MTMQLAGKTALITGSGGGICGAIALAFAEAGADVACCDIRQGKAEEAAQAVIRAGRRGLGFGCDVTSEADIQRVVDATLKELGRIDILVSGAAPHDRGGPVHQTSIAEWREVVDINLTASFLLSRAVVPHMIAAGSGSIIFIASQLGRVGSPGRAAYCATKGALIQLAKVMAIDHAEQNIRVNTLSPGAVETERTLNRYGSFAAANQAIGPKHLLGRLGRVNEIAPAAVFLASDAASFVTGSDLLVDGGYTAF